MRASFVFFLMLVAGLAAAQEIVYSIEISPAAPTTATNVFITLNGFCMSEPVRAGNVFTSTLGEACIDPPIQLSATYNVGRLAEGEYTVRIVTTDPDAPPLATETFIVAAAAPAVPTLHEYAAMLLAVALAAFAIRRLS